MVELITSLLQYAGISVTYSHPSHGLHSMCSTNFVSHFSVFCFLLTVSRVPADHIVNTIIKLALMAELLVCLRVLLLCYVSSSEM